MDVDDAIKLMTRESIGFVEVIACWKHEATRCLYASLCAFLRVWSIISCSFTSASAVGGNKGDRSNVLADGRDLGS